MDISATVVIYETLIVNIYQTFEEKRSVQYKNEERPKLNKHRYNHRVWYETEIRGLVIWLQL